MKLKHIIIPIILYFTQVLPAFSQNDTIQEKTLFSKKINIEAELQNAENKYYDGQIKETDSLLSIMINSYQIRKATKDQKEHIYRLAASCNLLLNAPEKAHKNIKKLLAVKPFYSDAAGNKDDMILFSQKIEALEKYALPKFQMGVMGGLNFANFSNPETERIVYDVLGSNPEGQYIPGNGIHISITAEYSFTRHISLSLEPGFLKHQFSYENKHSDLLHVPDIFYEQNLEYIFVPVLLKFTLFPTSPIKLYVQAGGYSKRLQTAKRNINSEGDISILDITKGTNFGAIAGFGIKLPQKHNSYFIDFKFLKSTNRVNDQDKKYDFEDETVNNMIFKYHNIETDLLLNSVHICIGYQRHLSYKVFKK